MSNNNFSTLPVGSFTSLTALETLNLSGNDLVALPAGVFAGLGALRTLRLDGNAFTPGTGLPAGVFDAVLDTLGEIGNDFLVDDTVRRAHFVCFRDDVDAIVAAAGVSDCLRISAAPLTTARAQLNPTAAILVGPLTEAGLFASPSPTVTVTLSNTQYVIAEPAAAHFRLTEDIDGAVTIVDVTRDNATTATLTLAYDNVDITDDGTLSVTVLAAGHTGTDDLPTATIPITASAGMNLCARTPWVRDAILVTIRPVASDCTNVTVAQLRSIKRLDLSGKRPSPQGSGDVAGVSGQTGTTLDLSGQGLSVLRKSDLAGLPDLTALNLSDNDFSTLPADVFADLTELEILNLSDNDIVELPTGVFAGLGALRSLRLDDNDLDTLPTGVFTGLGVLRTLRLDGNPLTARTGLPAVSLTGCSIPWASLEPPSWLTPPPAAPILSAPVTPLMPLSPPPPPSPTA